MKLKDFDYPLPDELIASRPLEERASSRLLVLTRTTGVIYHKRFADIPGQLRPGDLLVANDTKVIPARISGVKPTGGRVEVLLVERVDDSGGKDSGVEGEAWSCLVKPGKGTGQGQKILFDHGVEATVVEAPTDGLYTVSFEGLGGLSPAERLGAVPLPPYIKRPPDRSDIERYQTVFAARDGAVAAPTAGLHFSVELLDEIRRSGVEVLFITLHVGPGTFLPVRVDDIESHTIMEESYSISAEVSGSILKARAEGRRIVAVGTTTVRALEAAALTGGGDFEGGGAISGRTGIFIYPGFDFKVVSALITNFHLPRSTLLMLVCAFAGRDHIMKAYGEAIREEYRFFSYGDAMLIT
jgi:S-adenosylmethionine:tRNA ribosyltransferase-isomerase